MLLLLLFYALCSKYSVFCKGSRVKTEAMDTLNTFELWPFLHLWLLFLFHSEDSKLLEEAVVPLARTLSKLSASSCWCLRVCFWQYICRYNLNCDDFRTETFLKHSVFVSKNAHNKVFFCLFLFLFSLVENNPRTGNFGALVRIFLGRTKELKISTECKE